MTGCVGHNDCGCSPLWVGGSSTAHPHQCSGWSWERVVPAQCSPTLHCTVKHSGASLGGFSRRAALSYDQRAPPLSEIFDCLCAYFGRGMQIHLLCYIYNIFSLNTKHPSLSTTSSSTQSSVLASSYLWEASRLCLVKVG